MVILITHPMFSPLTACLSWSFTYCHYLSHSVFAIALYSAGVPSRSLTRPDFIPIFLQGCEIKSGRVRPGFEASYPEAKPRDKGKQVGYSA